MRLPSGVRGNRRARPRSRRSSLGARSAGGLLVATPPNWRPGGRSANTVTSTCCCCAVTSSPSNGRCRAGSGRQPIHPAACARGAQRSSCRSACMTSGAVPDQASRGGSRSCSTSPAVMTGCPGETSASGGPLPASGGSPPKASPTWPRRSSYFTRAKPRVPRMKSISLRYSRYSASPAGMAGRCAQPRLWPAASVARSPAAHR